MSQELSTFKIADLPSNYSRSIINVLQDFLDRLSPSYTESIQVAQLSSSVTSLNISGSQLSAPPAFGPNLMGSRFTNPADPEHLDARSVQAMNRARALTVKLQRHLRKQTAAYRCEAIDEFTIPYEKLPGHSLKVRWLALKPDGKQRARERGAREAEGNVLTLEMTQQLINLAYSHVAHNTGMSLRLVTEIVLLRLAAVLRAKNVDTERVCLLTDCPIRAVDIPGEDPDRTFGGVVDYVLAKYTYIPPPQVQGPENVLEAPTFQKLGSANIFHVQSVVELNHGLPQCVLAAASWCRQSGGQEAMRAAVTTGEYWIFFAYKRVAGEHYYARSHLFSVRAAEDILYVDWILGVLLDWIENTGNCDTFEYFEDPEYEYDGPATG